MRILIADDHDLVRETLAAFLLSEGFTEVRTVATLDAALPGLVGGAAFDSGPRDLSLLPLLPRRLIYRVVVSGSVVGGRSVQWARS